MMVCDIASNRRSKRIPTNTTDKVLNDEVRMLLLIVIVDIWGKALQGCESIYKTGDANGILIPPGWGLLPVNWTVKPSILLPLVLHNEDDTYFMGDPQNILISITQQFKDIDLTAVVATELEFCLYDP